MIDLTIQIKSIDGKGMRARQRPPSNRTERLNMDKDDHVDVAMVLRSIAKRIDAGLPIRDQMTVENMKIRIHRSGEETHI